MDVKKPLVLLHVAHVLIRLGTAGSTAESIAFAAFPVGAHLNDALQILPEPVEKEKVWFQARR
jgi:hypothetical protein